MAVLQYLINGLSIGSIYAIIALGYTMVYGIAKMLNFAHGDVIMVGAYISYCVMIYMEMPPVVAILAALTGIGVVVLERLSKDSDKKLLTAQILASASLVIGLVNAFMV